MSNRLICGEKGKSMNNQNKPNGIEWCDFSWNVFTGCLNTCEWCYARKIANRFWGNFEPKFYPERLNEPYKIKKPSRIFVGSMGDLYFQIPENVEKIIDVCRDNPQHTFLFLCKFSYCYRKYKFPWNCWLGETETGLNNIGEYLPIKNNICFKSYEPLLAEIPKSSVIGFDWAIIGGLTPTPAHKPEWVQSLIDNCRSYEVSIFLKSNLKWSEKIQEFPK
jgi:protein gp37